MSAAFDLRPPSRMTAREFMAWPDDGSGLKYNLVDGELVAMAPTSQTHSLIAARACLLIGNHLDRHRPQCRIGSEVGLPPRVRAEWNIRIPDVAVSCTPETRGQPLMTDPVLVVEVLSPGNERIARANVWAYASIPTVLEILLLQSLDIGAELLRRDNDGSWPERPEEIGADARLRLESIGGAFPLVDFYATTSLAPPMP